MLARVLALSPMIGAYHEPRPLLNAEAYLVWSGRDPWHPASLTESVWRKRWWLIRETRASNGLIYLESSHFLSHLIFILDGLWGAKFVHLVRNGRAFVQSGIRRPTWYGKMPLKQRMTAWLRHRLPEVDLGDSSTDHRLRPPRQCRTRVAKMAWLWAEVNRVCLRDLAAIPESRRMRLRVEDLGAEALAELLGFVRAEPDASLITQMLALARTKPDDAPSPKGRKAPVWGASEEEQFGMFAGQMMRQMGYK